MKTPLLQDRLHHEPRNEPRRGSGSRTSVGRQAVLCSMLAGRTWFFLRRNGTAAGTPIHSTQMAFFGTIVMDLAS